MKSRRPVSFPLRFCYCYSDRRALYRLRCTVETAPEVRCTSCRTHPPPRRSRCRRHRLTSKYPDCPWRKIRNGDRLCRRSRVDSYRVNSSFRGGVIETARTAGHSFRLRTECGEIGRTQRIWIGEIKLQMLSRRDAGGHACMLRCGGSQPCRIKTAGRKRQTVVPVLFQFCKTTSFVPCIAARHRHVALGPRGPPQRAIFAPDYGERYSG